MFDQIVEAISVAMKAIARDEATKLFAFTVSPKRDSTNFTIISNGDLFVVSVKRVEQ